MQLFYHSPDIIYRQSMLIPFFDADTGVNLKNSAGFVA